MSKLRKCFISIMLFFTFSSFCAVYADSVLVAVEESNFSQPIEFTINSPSYHDDEVT